MALMVGETCHLWLTHQYPMGKIIYEFKIENGETYTFEIDTVNPGHDGRNLMPDASSWTALRFKQCENCPLKTDQCNHCPVALDIENVASKFSHLLSWERADIWVHTDDRSYFKNCDLQNGLRSMLGLMMALSSCPILSQLRPLATQHLPFASFQESVSRIAGNYLIRQFLQEKKGNEPDWQLTKLKAFYRDLATVNFSILERIKSACEEDANLNAISIFFSMSSVVNMALEEQLEEMNDSFIDQFEITPTSS